MPKETLVASRHQTHLWQDGVTPLPHAVLPKVQDHAQPPAPDDMHHGLPHLLRFTDDPS